MTEKYANLKRRTKVFALDIIALTNSLPNKISANVIGRQLIRCGTSVGANYRSAARAKSPADFIAKMNIVEEEADESGYWMELLIESGVISPEATQRLMKEAEELVAIAVASIKTARCGSR